MFLWTWSSNGSETVSRSPIGYCSLGASGSILVRLYCIAKASLFQLRLPLATSFRSPVKGAHSEQVDKTCQQNCYENECFDESGPAAFADGHRPGKEKKGFDVEDHEEHRDQIEFCREPQTGAAGGQHAGFERFVFAAAPRLATEQA